MRYRVLLLSALLFGLRSHAAPTNLDGRWISNCWKLPKRHSVRSFLEFNGDRANTILLLYADDNCISLNLSLQTTNTFAFRSDSNTGFQFDFKPTRVELTLLREDVVAYYNANLQAACGLAGWEINRPRDVSGRSCSGQDMPQLLNTIYDFMQLDNGDLQFGSFSISKGSTDPKLRPPSVNEKVLYRRE